MARLEHSRLVQKQLAFPPKESGVPKVAGASFWRLIPEAGSGFSHYRLVPREPPIHPSGKGSPVWIKK